MSDATPREGELILYRAANDAVRVEVLYESETFWMDQRRIAELFDVEIPTISYHLKEIYASNELAREPTLRKILRVQRAEQQFQRFRVQQERAFESDFEVEVKRIESKRPSRRKQSEP